jgi:hypothetical protein
MAINVLRGYAEQRHQPRFCACRSTSNEVAYEVTTKTNLAPLYTGICAYRSRMLDSASPQWTKANRRGDCGQCATAQERG